MKPKPRGRSLHVSLRMLFVALTMFCIVVGWQTNVVRDRQAALDELKTKPGFTVTTAAMWSQRYPGGIPSSPAARISRVRTWLGDEAIQEIWYSWYPAPTQAEIDRLKQQFPEALIQEMPREPCHPGCFPAGTLVQTIEGPRPIETIVKGDSLLVLMPNGESGKAEVQSIFITENRLWEVYTDARDLLTTQTQPLCLATLTTKAAGDLQPGDVILLFQHGEIREAIVSQVRQTNRVAQVFNVVLGDRDLFIAGGFVVRSKPPADVLENTREDAASL